jgi:hypothetical protein
LTSIVDGEELCSESATYELCKGSLAATQDHAGAELFSLVETSTAGLEEASAEPSVIDEPSGGELQGFFEFTKFLINDLAGTGSLELSLL